MHILPGIDLHDGRCCGHIENAGHADEKHHRNGGSNPGNRGQEEHRQAERGGANDDVAYLDHGSMSDNESAHDGAEAENRIKNSEYARRAVQGAGPQRAPG